MTEVRVVQEEVVVQVQADGVVEIVGSPVVPSAAGAAVWGSISGTLSDQSDLTSALNELQDQLDDVNDIPSLVLLFENQLI